jgi:hypothetical protein
MLDRQENVRFKALGIFFEAGATMGIRVGSSATNDTGRTGRVGREWLRDCQLALEDESTKEHYQRRWSNSAWRNATEKVGRWEAG